MQKLLYFLSFLSPPALFLAVLMVAIGVKGDPMDLQLALFGVLLMLSAALALPRQGHPLTRVVERMTAPSKQKAEDAVKGVIDANMAALDFLPEPEPYHAG